MIKIKTVSYDVAYMIQPHINNFDCIFYYNQVVHSGKWVCDTRIWDDTINFIESPTEQQIIDFILNNREKPNVKITYFTHYYKISYDLDGWVLYDKTKDLFLTGDDVFFELIKLL